MMNSFEFDIGEKASLVARFLGEVRTELQRVFTIERASRKLTQQQIATLLEVNRSVINRQLTGVENLTARRIAEFAWALGYEPEFRLRKEFVEDSANDRPPSPPTSVDKSETYIPKKLFNFQVITPQ